MKLPTLNTLFRANALFSIACAIDLLFFTKYFAQWMGVTQPIYLQALGLGLILFAGYVAWLSMRPNLTKPLALQVIVADIGWVIGSLMLLVFNPFGFTLLGQGLVFAIGSVVLGFAILQIKATKVQCDLAV